MVEKMTSVNLLVEILLLQSDGKSLSSVGKKNTS